MPYIVRYSTNEFIKFDKKIRHFTGFVALFFACRCQTPVHYTEARTGDILRSVLSNDALKQTLGIVPAMKLPEGIKKTYAWYQNQQSEWK